MWGFLIYKRMTTEELKTYLSSFTKFVIGGNTCLPPMDRATLYFDRAKTFVNEMFIEDVYFERVGVIRIFTESCIGHSELLKLTNK